MRIFLIPLYIAFLNPQILGFLFTNLGSKMWKIKLQKILADFLETIRKWYMNGKVIQKILAVLKWQKILDNIWFFEQIFYRKKSLSAPDF